MRDAVQASIPAAVRPALDRHGAKVLLACGALPVEVAMHPARAESGDGPTNRGIGKCLFVSSPTVGACLRRSFRRYESQVRGHADECFRRPMSRHRTNR